jgi:hypothetical protein
MPRDDYLRALGAVEHELLGNAAFGDGSLDDLRELLGSTDDDEALVQASRRGGACAPFGVARILAKVHGATHDERGTDVVLEAGAVRIVKGDLHVAGTLRVVGTLVVTGSATVGRVVRDCGPDSCVAVAGSLRAGGIHTDGDFYVGGDLVAEVVYGRYNDNSLLVGGALRARLLVEDDHDVRAGAIDVEDHFGIDAVAGGVNRELAEILVPEVFIDAPDGDEYSAPRMDWERLFARLASGNPIFRKDAPDRAR